MGVNPIPLSYANITKGKSGVGIVVPRSAQYWGSLRILIILHSLRWVTEYEQINNSEMLALNLRTVTADSNWEENFKNAVVLE